ncbi:MAG: alkaline phosphatase family protein [Rhodospirillales bacterium]
MRKIISLSAAPFLVLATFMFTATAAVAENPKLVVQITVDQLRGDMPWRYYGRFGKGGFRYLMDGGTSFSNAHYTHATTFTAVGHAALFTGGNAAQHGLAGNDWYDQATGERVYCVEDPDNPIIGKKPSAKTKHKGTSPRNLTSSTIGDELVLASGGKSRVFSASIKDRGAILPGGQLGKAFWYSSGSGKFVTSTYYYDAYPAWAAAWNKADHAGKYQTGTWTLKEAKSKYVYGAADDRPSERGYKHLKATFPHKLGAKKKKSFYKALRFTPMGDKVTLDFVKTLMKNEKLGQGDATDMLAVSFSATDYLGHAYGPNSLEYEDNMLRLDATLADFFGYIDKTVGLDKTLIVLSSDHGIDAVPESLNKGFYMTRTGEGAGRHNPKNFLLRVNAALQKRYNSKEPFVVAFWNPSLYLELATIAKLNLDLAEVEGALREEILKVPGIALAVTRTDLLSGSVPDNPIMDKVQQAFHPTRSGNVLIVQKPGWYLYPKVTLFAAMHGSPYSYDTYVPIMFAGPGIKAQVVNRLVAPTDIAPTIANYLGIKPPSGSVGLVLPEVVDGTKSAAKKTM